MTTSRSLLHALIGATLAVSCFACGTKSDDGEAKKPDTQADDAGGEVNEDGGAVADAISAVDGGATVADSVSAGDDAGGGTDATTDAGSGGVDVAVQDAGSGGSDSSVPAPDVDETKGLTSKELLIKILGPSGRDWIQSEAQAVVLTGVLFGGADSMSWKDGDGTTGKIEPAAYWVSDIINLKVGDNTLSVTAKQGTKEVTDTVHIVYNPYFSFESAPQVDPSVLFVGESGKLIVHMPLSAAAGGVGGSTPPVNASTVHLIEVDGDGKEIKDHGVMLDNGQAGNCDDIQKDGIYSKCVSMTPTVAKTMYFRVRADVEILDKKYNGKSPLALVDVVPRMNQSECNAIVSLQSKVRSEYESKVDGGTAAAQAQAAAIAALKADPTVKNAGPASDGYGIWVQYKTGRLGALNLAPKGTRGGGDAPAGGGALSGAALPTYSVGTRRALTLAPNEIEFKADGGDEAAVAGADLDGLECPPFAVDAMSGNLAHLGWYRDMEEYGIVAITGHGDAYFGDMDAADKAALGWEHPGSQEAIWSGEAVNCSALSTSTAKCGKTGTGCPTGQQCVKTSANGGDCVDHTQADIMTGRVAIGAKNYALLPSFVQRHATRDFPESIIYLGTCRSLWNGSLAVQFFGLGAQAVVGYSDYITNKFAWSHGKSFFDGLVKAGENVLQAIQTTDADSTYGGQMRYLGKAKANAKDAKLINPSWDTGKRTGWKAVGDGRVISRLGSTVPVGGKFMGIISTGLGFTAQTGSLEQPFCVSPGASEMCFHWKFYSEEFVEWCGSSYMDRFTATLTGDAGGSTKKLTMVDVWIDPLCPYDCGGKNPCEAGSPSCKCGQQWKGLSQSDVTFDQGGVWMTLWQTHCSDIKVFEGKRVTLKFFATDKGDSIYDTAVLVDDVVVK